MSTRRQTEQSFVHRSRLATVALLVGLVTAFQAADQLRQFGANIFIANLVGLGVVREMGPLITAILIAGRSGSAMAAELGTMTVSEETDALEVMGVDTAKFLVMPRVLAMALVTPVLTVYSIFLGTLGGALTSYYQYGVTFELFKTDALEHLSFKDIYSGLFKAFIFGVVVAVVGCAQGLRARGGAIGVGLATRRSVVVSFLLIIVLGYYVTWLFYRLLADVLPS